MPARSPLTHASACDNTPKADLAKLRAESSPSPRRPTWNGRSRMPRPGGTCGRAHCAVRRGLSVEVMGANDSERRKGPAHARKRALPRENEERLSEIGRQLPPPSEGELEIVAGLRASRRRRRLLAWGTAFIVAALC